MYDIVSENYIYLSKFAFCLTVLSVLLWFLKKIFGQTVSVGRRKFSANFQLVFRLIKGMIFLTFVAILVTLIALPHMTLQDIVVCILAFMPTGWGMLLVSVFIIHPLSASILFFFAFVINSINYTIFGCPFFFFFYRLHRHASQ